jgi:adenylylsulfate kinase-like enzyme
MEILIQRDQKQLYSRALKGETQQVMGIDLPFNEPNNPDIILENKGDSTPQLLAERILKLS